MSNPETQRSSHVHFSPLPLLCVQLVARLSSRGVLRLVLRLVKVGVAPASLAPVCRRFSAAARLLRETGAGSSSVGMGLRRSADGPL